MGYSVYFPCNSLHLHDFYLLLLYARKNYKSTQCFKSNLKKQSIMTTSIQTSAIISQFGKRTGRRTGFYQVVVNGEDGNYQEYEIEASSEADAREQADRIAQSEMMDVIYVEVYRIA